MRALTLAVGLASAALVSSAAAAAEPSEKLWCLRYATAPGAPLLLLLAGAPPEQKADVPVAIVE